MSLIPSPHPADTLACFAITILCLCTVAGVAASFLVSL